MNRKKINQLDFILNRKSIRKFTGKIPEDDINSIIRCGQRAPSSGNAQLYSLIEIRNSNLRNTIMKICHNQKFIIEASHFFIICIDIRRIEKMLNQVGIEKSQPIPTTIRRFMSGIIDATVVAQNMVIAAEILGYSSIYIGSITSKTAEICKCLNLPKGVMPLVGLAIGISAENPPKRPRIPQKMIWHVDKYLDPTSEEISNAIETIDRTLQHENYFNKYYSLKDLFTDSPDEQYKWSTHMCNKFWEENWEEIDHKQKCAIKNQGVLNI